MKNKMLLGAFLVGLSSMAFAEVNVEISNDIQPTNGQVLIVNGKPVVVNNNNNGNTIIQNGKGVTYVPGDNGTMVVIPNNNVSYVTARDTTSGVIVINGKPVSYPKCIPKDATPEQAQQLKNQLANVKRSAGNIKIELDPNNIQTCL